MARDRFAGENAGYQKGLTNRHLQMIAIGGAIGTGLFLGSGGLLAEAGPLVPVIYLVCGVFVFFVLRALLELTLYRPSSGSFISYSREFLGEKIAYAAGWLYWAGWGFTGIADATAVALYVHYWKPLTVIPQWVLALIALAIVLAINLLGVRIFGELEFWFALIKVVTLLAFLVFGAVFLIAGWPTEVGPTGFAMVAENGGFAPTGILPGIVLMSGVVFAYAGVELVGTASGEVQDVQRSMPRAINSVMIRIAIFYIGTLVVLSLALPYTTYKSNESPLVTFFSSITGDETSAILGSIVNVVVITAALSSLNAGMFSTGRILRSMAFGGAAPEAFKLMTKSGVPWVGMVITIAMGLVGVGLNYVVPESAFNIMLNLAAIGSIAGWVVIILAQMRMRRLVRRGELEPPKHRMPGAPVTSWLVLAFLLAVIVLMGLDWPVGTWTLIATVPLCLIIWAGWFLARKRIAAIDAAEDAAEAEVESIAEAIADADPREREDPAHEHP